MVRATNIARGIIGITGLIQIGSGLLFWTGNAFFLIPFHMHSGLILSITLLIVAILGALAGVTRGFVALTVFWSILTPAFGLTQAGILPGPYHWVVQVLHLLVGLAAMALGHRLALRIQDARAPEAAGAIGG